MDDADDGVPAARGPKWAPVGVSSLIASDAQSQASSPGAGAEIDAPQPVNHVASSDLAVGRLFGGKYRVVDRLGAGGMAVVYRAQERGLLTREVALKVLTPESALSQGTIARFLKEAQAISNIRHPNVVQLIELGRTDEGQIYLVMERLVGKTLYEAMRELGARGEVFAWEQLAPLILDICGALQAAHKQKIIHRDMKPSNCFLCEREDERPYVKVLDFGIAKVQTGGTSEDSVETPLTQDGMFLGTPHYAAPEIVNRRPDETLDGRVDIFALGVMMYQCLTGTLPFQEVRDSRVAVLYRAAHERPESPRQRAPQRGIPFEVDALVMRAMEIDLDRRFATVAELAAAIRATLQATPGGGGIAMSGSILEIAPTAVSGPVPERVAHKSIIVGSRGPADEQATPPPPGHPTTTVAPESPTSVQAPGGRSTSVAIAILVAMVLGLVVLFALITLEIDWTPAGPKDAARSPEAHGRPELRSAPSATVEPRDGRRAETASPPIRTSDAPPSSARPPLIPPAPPAPASEPPAPAEAAPKRPTPSDVVAAPRVQTSTDAQLARKKAIRERLDELAESETVVPCLPVWLMFSDHVYDELPVVVRVDAAGKAKASASKKKVARRLPDTADACILKAVGAASFPAGDGTISVSHTLRFD